MNDSESSILILRLRIGKHAILDLGANETANVPFFTLSVACKSSGSLVSVPADPRPVYEMICRDVAVMRRRSDAYLNATQILKVAGFDKPQRTRVLEREVQKGEHEKVQGGYGKYQGESTLFAQGDELKAGTWIPIERGLALAKQYEVEDLLRPIIDYVPTSVSPPPAPKHAVAPPSKPRKEKKEISTPLKTGPTSAAALQAQAQLAQSGQKSTAKKPRRKKVQSTPEHLSSERDEEEESIPEPAPRDDDESSSMTPSPVPSAAGATLMDIENAAEYSSSLDPGSSARKRTVAEMMDEDVNQYERLQRARGGSAVHTPHGSPQPLGPGVEPGLGPEQYTDIILTYFVSETSQIPPLLVSPPPDFNANEQIDEDGHTALHWACAMGRVRVVKLLLTAGASIFLGNSAEQTPLMRSVMFSNNYDVRKFPELYELLHRSTLNIDKHNRTVFHHIANLALTKGKTHAARYYMETILSRLSDYPQELADVINFQDEDGETALTLAARARSRRLVKALLDHGADPKIKNRDFKSAEDYILEDERFRSSPVRGSNGDVKPSISESKPPMLYSSEAAKLAGGTCLNDITAHMQSLARSFDAELQGKERAILQAKALLTSTHADVTETTKRIAALNEQSAPLDGAKRELEALQRELHCKIGDGMRDGFETWNAGQESRLAAWSNGEMGDYSDLEAEQVVPAGGPEVVQAEEDRLRWEIEEKRRKRKELVSRLVTAQADVS